MEKAVIGHDAIVGFFETVMRHGTLSHAYCFIGRPHAGKATVARRIGAGLLNTQTDRLRLSPDFVSIERTVDTKTGALKKDISIDQIRGVITFLSEKAFMPGGYKVVIIDGARHLSLGAANALLKTLEDHKQKTVTFLIADDDSELLPTIRSRCQMIYFSAVSKEKLEQFALDLGMEPAAVRETSEQAHGMPGLLAAWAENPHVYEEYKKEYARFNGLFFKPLYQKIKDIEDLFGDKTDHIAARDRIADILDVWHLALRDSILDREAPDRVAGHVFVEVEQRLSQAKRHIMQNIHPRLLIEHVVLSIP